MSRGVVSLFVFAAILLTSDRANAAGALAEGIAPGGIVRGYAFGVSFNEPNSDVARTKALAACKKGPEQLASGSAPDSNFAKARAQCKVVGTFSDKCAALALDPKDGTPGVGWAVGDTQKQAADEALARCRSTAGASRRDFCKIDNQKCDGTAK
jgi:uncharacterized protein DUF4189